MLSIIIPAFNEEKRIPNTLRKVSEFIQAYEFETEVLVIDNGSTDRTSEIAGQFAATDPHLRLFHEAQAGKGLAIRRGMLEASGEYRFICDADLSMPIEEVVNFLPPNLENFDIAIGSREAPGAIRYDEPVYRHWVGRAFNALVWLLAVRGFKDTQCGFKCFRGPVAEELFRVQRLDGWTFDVEVLFIAQKRGYRIVEVPIHWYYYPASRIRVVTDSLRMFSDLFRIRRNWAANLYAIKPIEEKNP